MNNCLLHNNHISTYLRWHLHKYCMSVYLQKSTSIEYRHKVVQDLNFLRACNAIVSTPRCFLLPFVNILCGLAARCVSSLRSRPTRSSAVFEWRSTKPCRSYRTCSAQHCSWPSSGLLGNRPHTPMSFLPPKRRSNGGRDKCQIKIIVVIRAAGFAYEPLSSLPC